jgi:hypothetical protein
MFDARLVLTTETQMHVSASASPTTILRGQFSQLGVTVTGGTPPYRFFWDPRDSLNDRTLATPKATPTVTTDYVVSVVDAAGQIADAMVTVNAPSGPTAFKLTVIGGDSVGAVSSTPTGVGFGCGRTCSASFASGTTVSLVSELASAVTWSGCDSVDSNPEATRGITCTVVMSADRNVTVSP